MLVLSLLLDLAGFLGAFIGAYWLRFNLPFLPPRPEPDFDLYLRFSFFVCLAGISFLYSFGIYRKRWPALGLEEFFALLKASLLCVVTIIMATFLFREQIFASTLEAYSRMILGFFWTLSLLLLTGWRLGATSLLGYFWRKGWGMNRLLILGVNPTSVRFYRALSQQRHLGYQVAGFLHDGDSPGQEQPAAALPVLGDLDRLVDILRTQKIHEVVSSLGNPTPDLIVQLINTCKRAGVRLRIISDISSLLLTPADFQELAGFPVFSPREQLLDRWNRRTKRMMDLVLAAGGLILSLPLWIVLCLAIRLGSKGSVFFTQERIGKNEKPFRMYKFRSMYADAEARWEALRHQAGAKADPLLRLRQDPRVTRIGRFMRRFSLDELPQVINVLKGEMSLVGPRPHILAEVAHYQEWQKKKFDVLPGLTGLTQVSGRKDLTLEDMIKLDIYYIENWSVWLDFKIILQTIPIVFSGRGAY